MAASSSFATPPNTDAGAHIPGRGRFNIFEAECWYTLEPGTVCVSDERVSYVACTIHGIGSRGQGMAGTEREESAYTQADGYHWGNRNSPKIYHSRPVPSIYGKHRAVRIKFRLRF